MEPGGTWLPWNSTGQSTAALLEAIPCTTSGGMLMREGAHCKFSSKYLSSDLHVV